MQSTCHNRPSQLQQDNCISRVHKHGAAQLLAQHCFVVPVCVGCSRLLAAWICTSRDPMGVY